jgi:hypothetical protein
MEVEMHKGIGGSVSRDDNGIGEPVLRWLIF